MRFHTIHIHDHRVTPGFPKDDDEDQLMSGDSAGCSCQSRDYITESNGQYTVHAESGKHLGTYGSKSAAEKRLRQIEYFKHRGDSRVH